MPRPRPNSGLATVSARARRGACPCPPGGRFGRIQVGPLGTVRPAKGNAVRKTPIIRVLDRLMVSPFHFAQWNL
jgi:hypothetical protein